MRVYFNISAKTRTRILETIQHLPKGVEAVLPPVQPKKDHELSGVDIGWVVRLGKVAFRLIGKPNIKHAPDLPNIDVVYAPGHLVDNAPFITELDNPVTLAYYEP